jgi:hypothetical protein
MLGVPAPLLDAGGSFDLGQSSIQEGWSIQSSHLELSHSSCYVLIDESHRGVCVPILASALFRPPALLIAGFIPYRLHPRNPERRLLCGEDGMR